MPFYLLHGFRWPRELIRIHIIVNQLDEAAPEWLMAPATTESLVRNLHDTNPAIMKSLKNLLFIEQYDPADLESSGQPYAYVADTVFRAELSMDLAQHDLNIGQEQDRAIHALRNALVENEDDRPRVGWFIVFCGDEQRAWHMTSDEKASDKTQRPVSTAQMKKPQAPNGAEARTPAATQSGANANSSTDGDDSAGSTGSASYSSAGSAKSKESGSSLRRGLKKFLARSPRKKTSDTS